MVGAQSGSCAGAQWWWVNVWWEVWLRGCSLGTGVAAQQASVNRVVVGALVLGALVQLALGHVDPSWVEGVQLTGLAQPERVKLGGIDSFVRSIQVPVHY